MPRLPHSYRVDAVVLRHSDWGEADRLLTLFTREQGKVRAIAKGARKIRSRKAGHIEPFTHVTLQLALGRDLAIVTQAETIDAYLPLREDLVRTGYATYVAELLDRFTYEEGENEHLFRLLVDTLGRISLAEEPLLAVRYFEIQMLDLAGFRPELFYCVNCGREIQPEDQFFSFNQGGVLCPNCGQSQPEARPVTMEALRFLRHYQRSTYTQAIRLLLAPAIQSEVEELLQDYLTFLLERHLNSPNIIRQFKKDA